MVFRTRKPYNPLGGIFPRISGTESMAKTNPLMRKVIININMRVEVSGLQDSGGV